MSKELTFVMLKPSTITRGLIGQVITRFENKGLKIVGLKMHAITQAEAEALLKKDLKKFVEGVNALIHVPLNQNQADALYSFAYNCGVQALAKSTLLSELNSKDYKSAANEFLKLTRGSGKILPGLVTRRETERALFLKPVPQPHPYPGNVIKEGSTNTVAVKEIQKQLGITADGVFGPNTKAAVVKFQKAHGLASDGIVGNVTWNVLF
jgi:lysozyme